jgi:CspA family cold shock protein
MTTGTIKKIVGDRGFGFIAPATPAADGKDLFFHRADVGGNGFDSLREGQAVTYVLGTDERRGSPKALQVKSA